MSFRAASTRAHRFMMRSEEHTSELQSPCNLVCRLLLEKKNVGQNAIEEIDVITAGGKYRCRVLAGTPRTGPDAPLAPTPRSILPPRRHRSRAAPGGWAGALPPYTLEYRRRVHPAHRVAKGVGACSRVGPGATAACNRGECVSLPCQAVPQLFMGFFFFFNDPAPPETSPLPLHAPLPILKGPAVIAGGGSPWRAPAPRHVPHPFRCFSHHASHFFFASRRSSREAPAAGPKSSP